MSKEFVTFMVNNHFGPSFASVVTPLVDAEELQLGEIARDAKLEIDQLRPIIIILLKNGIIEHSEKLSSGGKPATFYKLNVENVINLSMYPRYLSFFEDKFSILARSLAESMMIGGTMTMPECIHTTRENAGLELEGEEVNEADYIQEFGTLVSLNYLVPVHKTIWRNQMNEEKIGSFDAENGHGISKRKPEGGSGVKKSAKKIKSSKNYMLEDSLAAGKLIDM